MVDRARCALIGLAPCQSDVARTASAVRFRLWGGADAAFGDDFPPRDDGAPPQPDGCGEHSAVDIGEDRPTGFVKNSLANGPTPGPSGTSYTRCAPDRMTELGFDLVQLARIAATSPSPHFTLFAIHSADRLERWQAWRNTSAGHARGASRVD